MNNFKKTILLIALALTAVPALAAGIPHTSYGVVDGTEISTTCAWSFYVVSRPAEKLSGAISKSGSSYFWQALVGNLSTPWNLGDDTLAIVKKENGGGTASHAGYYAVMNEDLTNEFPQQYNNCTLRAIPVPTPAVSGSSVNLTWTAAQTDASVNNHGNNILGYNLYRSESPSSGFAKINASIISATAYNDAAGTIGKTYYYALEPVFRGNVALGFNSANSSSIQYPGPAQGNVVINLTYNASAGNLYWISVPYTNTYSRASDVIAKINADSGQPADSGNKVTQIGRFDPATQSYQTYDYLGFLGWSGNNFVLVKGESIFINIASNINATLVGNHDPAFAFSLTYSAAAGNIYWLSLPTSGNYTNAVSIISDINASAGLPADSGSLVTQIGRWNGATQTYETYDYLGFLGWSGSNFNFVPGEGYLINLAGNIISWKPKIN